MLTTYDYKAFKAVDRQIDELYKDLSAVSKTIGDLASFLCRMAGIDCEYYHYWLTGKLDDLAELIILYLSEDERQRALEALELCKTI